MTGPTKRNLERQLSTLCAGPEATAFRKMCRAWLNLESNQNGRGTKAQAVKQAYYASVWFKRAQLSQQHQDDKIRHKAKKAIRAVPHENFPLMRNRLGKFHGQLSKYGIRLAEERRKASERSIELGNRYELKELRSLGSLQSAGRALQNCTAKRDMALFYLNGNDEMWALLHRKRPLCLLAINKSTRELAEFEGEGGATLELDRSFAFRILNVLDINGDEQKAFASIGAYHAFRGGQPVVNPVEIESTKYWIWLLNDGDEIVVASQDRTDDRKYWSRFSRENRTTTMHPRRRMIRPRPSSRNDGSGIAGNRWNHLSIGDLWDLVIDHPLFAEKLRELRRHYVRSNSNRDMDLRTDQSAKRTPGPFPGA